MSLLLNIDTTGETAFVSIAENGAVAALKVNENMRDHASFLHPAIQAVMLESGRRLNELDAIAVNAGPGSYTGIRIGMAAAKGCCFALQIPLIQINSLELLAVAAISRSNEIDPPGSLLFCPMIDARRMEVFTAVYDLQLHCLQQPQAMILTESSFSQFLPQTPVVFTGSGAPKWQHICTHFNARFMADVNLTASMARLSEEYFRRKSLASVALSDAYYIKDFHSGQNPA